MYIIALEKHKKVSPVYCQIVNKNRLAPTKVDDVTKCCVFKVIGVSQGHRVTLAAVVDVSDR